MCLSDARRIHDWASSPVFGMDFDKRRKLHSARDDAVRAARFKRASGRKLGNWGHGAFDGRERSGAVSHERGNRAQQTLSIRMRGRAENIDLRAELDQVAGVHHGATMGNM